MEGIEGIIFFFGIVTAGGLCALLYRRREERRQLLRWVCLPLVMLAVRFGPYLLGLEWRVPYRGVMEWVWAVLLVLWAAQFALEYRGRMRRLLAVPACAMALFLVMNQVGRPAGESVLFQEGRPVCVRENNSPGSMAGTRFFRYVNGTFRSLGVDWDLLDDWWDGLLEEG